jgi:hypothetical protein
MYKGTIARFLALTNVRRTDGDPLCKMVPRWMLPGVISGMTDTLNFVILNGFLKD